MMPNYSSLCSYTMLYFIERTNIYHQQPCLSCFTVSWQMTYQWTQKRDLDLTNVCRDASFNGMRQKISGKTTEKIKNMSKSEILNIPVTMDDLLEALDKIKPTVSAGDIQRYEKWLSQFGSSQKDQLIQVQTCYFFYEQAAL